MVSTRYRKGRVSLLYTNNVVQLCILLQLLEPKDHLVCQDKDIQLCELAESPQNLIPLKNVLTFCVS